MPNSFAGKGREGQTRPFYYAAEIVKDEMGGIWTVKRSDGGLLGNLREHHLHRQQHGDLIGSENVLTNVVYATVSGISRRQQPSQSFGHLSKKLHWMTLQRLVAMGCYCKYGEARRSNHDTEVNVTPVSNRVSTS